MSFPVLQRMDRKRPEMIQPISWQAEAMRGLAQGLQTGVQLASTVNQIKLQQAANARAEALHGVELQLAQQRGKAQDLAMRKLGLDVQQAEMENMMGIAQSEAAIKLESNKIKMQEYAFMGETLKDTSKISQWRAERFDIGTMSDPVSASLRAGEYDANIPPEQNRAMTMAAEKFSPAAARAVMSVLPQPLFDEIEQKPVHIDVTDSNRGSAIAAFSAQAEGSPEEIQHRLQLLEAGQTKTIAVRFGTLVERVRDDAEGSVDMLAKLYKSRDATPEAVSNYLAARHVSPTQIKKVTDAMQGKPDVAVADKPDVGIGLAPVPTTTEIDVGGEKYTVPTETAFDRAKQALATMALGETRAENIYRNLPVTKNFPATQFARITDKAIPFSQSISRGMRKVAEYVERATIPKLEVMFGSKEKVAEHVGELRATITAMTAEQNAAVKSGDYKKARALTEVVEWLKRDESAYESAGISKSSKESTTPASAPASAPATAGARTSRPVQGDVVEGYRFKGGDPSKPENWEKVQ